MSNGEGPTGGARKGGRWLAGERRRLLSGKLGRRAVAGGVVIALSLLAGPAAAAVDCSGVPINITETSEERSTLTLVYGMVATPPGSGFPGLFYVGLNALLSTANLTQLVADPLAGGADPQIAAGLTAIRDALPANPALEPVTGSTETSLGPTVEKPSSITDVFDPYQGYLQTVTGDAGVLSQPPAILQGTTGITFDETTDFPIVVGNILIACDRFINHVTHPVAVSRLDATIVGFDHYLQWAIRPSQGSVCAPDAPLNADAACEEETDCGSPDPVRRPGGAGSGPHRSTLPRPLPAGRRRATLGARSGRAGGGASGCVVG